LPYWKAKRLYSIALYAQTCDSLLSRYVNVDGLSFSLEESQDSLVQIRDSQIVILKETNSYLYRVNTKQLAITKNHKRKATFWQGVGIAGVILGILIASR